jgi:hypothetical protein
VEPHNTYGSALHLESIDGASMKTRISSTPVVFAMIIIALVSLLILVGQNQLDQIIKVDLYSFGLRFSYLWATPYWLYSALVIGFSWFNIIASIAITYHTFRGRLPPRIPEAGMVEEATEHGEQLTLVQCEAPEDDEPALPADEVDERPMVSEVLIEPNILLESPAEQPGGTLPASAALKKYDVRRPREIVDSQC